MQQNENAPLSTTRFEERLGAAVAFSGALFVVASLVLSSTTMSGCGPCWPGPCADAQPTTSVTPTPTPTPTATVVDCPITRTPGLLNGNVYQVDSDLCPQILLDPEGPRYDATNSTGTQDFCEAGVWMDGTDDVFLYRYSCDSSEPWMLAVATSTDEGITLERECPPELTQTQLYSSVETLEPVLWERDTDAIRAQAVAWQDACVAEDASEAQLEQCAAICADPPTQTLYGGLEALGELPDDPTLLCYLRLYQTPAEPSGGTAVVSTDETTMFDTSCFCAPTPEYLTCLVETSCFDADHVYDPVCGAECWVQSGTQSDNCTEP